ncbi:MAG: hypothetical protein P8J94_04325 [Gammaproteobacteria bacterium]|jgi:hypothetical protein|nr:hypothetical protein [Gammaproteobacteria bacterium]|tara:strand:+ start:15217 stop:15666 length:450 start_codon:yes stop_codon:yes gene_type:complete
MKNIAWLDNGLWEYYTQELDRILCGTVESDEHKELVSIYSHYLQEEKIIPIQLQEYINFYLKENSLDSSSRDFNKQDEYFNLILVVCVRWKESRGDNRTNAIGLIANLFDVSAESIFKIYDECKENADQYISIMPNMREISNFLDTSQS